MPQQNPHYSKNPQYSIIFSVLKNLKINPPPTSTKTRLFQKSGIIPFSVLINLKIK
jgi:hypothetical protein